MYFLLVLTHKMFMSSCLPFLISSDLVLHVVKKKKKKGIVALFLVFPKKRQMTLSYHLLRELVGVLT